MNQQGLLSISTESPNEEITIDEAFVHSTNTDSVLCQALLKGLGTQERINNVPAALMRLAFQWTRQITNKQNRITSGSGLLTHKGKHGEGRKHNGR